MRLLPFSPVRRVLGMPGNRNFYANRPRPHARDRNVIVHYGGRGLSHVQMARALGVGRTTLSRWAKKCPKFSAAFELARDCAQAYWEELGERNLGNESFNSTVYNKIMSCRFRRDYGNKHPDRDEKPNELHTIKRVLIKPEKPNG